MNRLIKKAAGLVAGLLILGGLKAQENVLAVVEKISTAYKHSYPISFSGHIKMYRKGNPSKIIEKIETQYTMQQENFTCRIGSVVMVLNDKYYVSADSSVKILVVGRRAQLAGTEQIPAVNLTRFKQLITEKRITADVLLNGSESVLQLKDSQAVTGYNAYQIFYDGRTGYMQKVLIELSDPNDSSRKAMVLEIKYAEPFRITEKNDFFSEKKFFSLVNHQVEITPAYKAYQLINQL